MRDRRIVDGSDQRERPGAGPEIVARAAAPAIPVLSAVVVSAGWLVRIVLGAVHSPHVYAEKYW